MALSGVFGNVFGDGDHAPTSQVVDGVSYNNGNLVGTYDTGGGGIIPSENDVRLGVSVGATTGNLRVPAVGDVRLGTVYDSSDTLTGTLDVDGEANYPTEPQVQSGITYGSSSQFTGSLDVDTAANLPEVAEVLLGVTYGSSSQLTGTLDVDDSANLPTEQQVAEGVTYGSQLQFTGTLDPGAGATDYPAEVDVRFDTDYAFGASTGLLVSPDPGDVRLGVSYGSNGEYVGTWDGSTVLPGDEGWIG